MLCDEILIVRGIKLEISIFDGELKICEWTTLRYIFFSFSSFFLEIYCINVWAPVCACVCVEFSTREKICMVKVILTIINEQKKKKSF